MFGMVTSRKIIFILFAAILLFLVAGCRLDTQSKKSDCGTAAGVELDQCLSALAWQELDGTLCGEIRHILIRDICYRDVFLGNATDVNLEDLDRQFCPSISNTLLRYQCSALYPRAAIYAYFSDGPPTRRNPVWNGTGECSMFDGYHGPLCVSLKAASLAGTNLSEARQLCGRLGNDSQVGECTFFVASALSKGIENYTAEQARAIASLCETIREEDLASACYSVLIDELVTMEPSAPLDEIARIYPGSVFAPDYINFLALKALPWFNEFHAVNYVLVFKHLSQSQRREFCLLLNSTLRSICFKTLADVVTLEVGYDAASGTAECRTFPTEYQDMCLLTLAWGFGAGKLEPFEMNIALCEELQGAYRDNCFDLLGNEVGNLFPRENLSDIKKLCSKFPRDAEGRCFSGLGLWIGHAYDIATSVVVCNNFTPESRDGCFAGLSQFIVERFLGDIPRALDQCKELPREFRQSCYDKLSWALAGSIGADIPQGIENCDGFSGASREGCLNVLMEHIIMDFASDADFAAERCNQLPGKPKDKCLAALGGR